MAISGNPAGLPDLAFTHAGWFHADDVFSAALLRSLRPDIRIYRGFEVPKGFSGIVFDIGEGEFDHHGRDREKRENGTPYAAFGLLWRKYGHHLANAEVAKSFDEKFIQPLDMDDNHGTGNVVATMIGAFNPPWDSDADMDEAFEEAVEVAQKLLCHRLESMAAAWRGKKEVEKALVGMRDGIVVLPVYVPWKMVLADSAAEFVVFPSVRGNFSLQCVPKEASGKTGLKVPLPAAWRGRSAEELQQITGVPDVTFCHASGFMAAVGSVEGAQQLAALAQAEEARRLAQSREARQANAPQAARNAGGRRE